MSKADNMLSILWLLKAGKRMTAKQLAEMLEINIRTVYRYIDALCASGVPIISDPGHNGGYSVLPNFTEAPLFFHLDEQKALIHAAVFAQEAGYPFGDSLEQAIAKLKRFTNEKQLETINRHVVGFDVIQPPPDASLNGYLQELELSVAECCTLMLEYQTSREPAPKGRNLDPYGLVNWKNKWYVVGHCHLRNEIRSFRVDRIRSLQRSGAVFIRPENFSARDFFMGSLLPDPSQTDRLIAVRIVGKSQALDDLCKHWLLGHVVVERTETEVVLMLDEQSILSLAPYFLLSYGKAIRVLEPPQLKQRLVSIVADLLDFYQTADNDNSTDRNCQ